MALLNNDKKLNFDTTLSANYDANGDGTGLNPQPLQVDANGALIVSGGGGIIQGQNDVTGLGVNLSATTEGSLAGGGWRLPSNLGTNYTMNNTEFLDKTSEQVGTFVYIGINSLTSTIAGLGFKQIVSTRVDVIPKSNGNFNIFVCMQAIK